MSKFHLNLTDFYEILVEKLKVFNFEKKIAMNTQNSNNASSNQQAQKVVVIQNRKSPVLAGILAFLFGPLGMLYSTVMGALVMFIISLIVAFFTGGLGLLITIPIGVIWAIIAANNHNKKIQQV